MVLSIIAVISAIALLIFCGLLFRDDEGERGALCLVIGLVALISGIFGIAYNQVENFATSVEEGYYTIDTNAVIYNCDDDVDAFALKLKSKGIDTIKIEKNKGRIATEFVCIVEDDEKDLTFYLDYYEVKKLIEVGAIKSN